MGRIIKFRGWDNGIFNDVCVSDDMWTDSLVSDNWHIGNIMQYTGLKDKNGKEIYEGDIVRQFPKGDFAGFARKVDFLNGAFGYYPDADFLNFIPYATNSHFYFDDKGQSIHIDVIGNVYENPELLPKETDVDRSVANAEPQ